MALASHEREGEGPDADQAQQNSAVLDGHGGNLRFLTGAIYCRRRNRDGLRGDDLAHHTTGGVCGNEQGRVNSDLGCGGGLQAREEHVSVGHGAGYEHADPTDNRGQ